MKQIYKDFEKLVKKQHDELRKLYAPSKTDCFRVYDRQQENLPVVVERYGDHLLVECIESFDSREVEELADRAARMCYIPPERVVLKERKALPGGTEENRSGEAPSRVTGTEMGLSYYIDLWSYRDTGLFLDHAVTRDVVREHAAGKRVLNLFSYTGSFTVCAAAGGAVETVSVDLSNTYLDWMQDNLELNKLQAPVHRNIRQDVLKFLKHPPGDIGRFHIIVFDPPTFSNSSSMDTPFRVQQDYPRCIRQCAQLLTDDGVILFSTNYGDFTLDKRNLKEFRLEEITRETIPPGFTAKRFPHRCWMIRRR